MTFDDAIKYAKENSFVEEMLSDVVDLEDMIEILENLKKEYAPTVEMTRDDEVKAASDMVNSPKHYTQFSREVIDTMADISTNEEFKGYLKLNAIKYLSRYQSKNGVEDLEKAIWYVTKLRDVLKKEAME